MSQIIIKKDNELKKPKIIIALTNSSKDEMGDKYNNNQQEVQQSLVYGIQVPLIEVNNIVVNFEDVTSFSLKSVSHLPTVTMTIKDRYNLITEIDTPGADNELVVQILPKFDKVYKKINLVFYISDFKANNGFIQISGVYKSQKFLSSNIKSFGEINTYKLFETIAKETKLGFATNIEENDEDKRYVYCDYKTYQDILNREITCGGTKEQVLDYWVDFWDNINLVDIRERYEAKDSDEDMQIWVAGRNKTVTEGTVIEPIKTLAVINNNPSMKANELYASKYNIINRTGGQIYSGSDKLFSTYEIEKEEYVDYLVQDGDVKNDIYKNFEYMGEVYGKYNYLLSTRKREAFMYKLNSEIIEVTLKTPLLGLMRGHKVNFMWYDNNSIGGHKKSAMDAKKITNPEATTNIDITGSEGETDTKFGKFKIDESVSGQYLIIGCNMKFENSQWNYVVTLTRPAKDKPNILKQIKENNNE